MQSTADDGDTQGETVYPKERIKMLFVVLFMLFAMSANHLALAVIHDIAGRTSLPDLIFELVPEQQWALPVGDGLCLTTVIVSNGFLLLLHRHRWIVLRRELYIAGVLYTMRAVSISVTQLPASYHNGLQRCRKPLHWTEPGEIGHRFLSLLITMGAQLKDEHGQNLCGDLLYSGHALSVSLATFTLNHYTPPSLWPLRWLIIVCCMAGMVCVTISRMHYSIDVLVGYWMCTLIFSLYHAFCDVPREKRTRSSMFRRLWLFWTMFELEKNVPCGRLPNELDWILPWPHALRVFLEKWNRAHHDCSVGNISRTLSDSRLRTHM